MHDATITYTLTIADDEKGVIVSRHAEAPDESRLTPSKAFLVIAVDALSAMIDNECGCDTCSARSAACKKYIAKIIKDPAFGFAGAPKEIPQEGAVH